MSLQDIKQVLSRIIILNKNLDEDRLNNLLTASGWEKQNKEEALSIFKILGAKEGVDVRRQQSEDAKKNMKNLIEKENKEISTEVIEQELSVVDNKELSTDVKKEDIASFIPEGLPIKEEDQQEMIKFDDKESLLTEVADIVPVKMSINEEEKSKEINWVPLLAILLIIFLLAFGYMYSHKIL